MLPKSVARRRANGKSSKSTSHKQQNTRNTKKQTTLATTSLSLKSDSFRPFGCMFSFSGSSNLSMAISDSFGNPLLLSLCKTSDDDDDDDDDNDVDVVESITSAWGHCRALNMFSNDEFRVAYYLFASYHYTSVRSRVLRTLFQRAFL